MMPIPVIKARIYAHELPRPCLTSVPHGATVAYHIEYPQLQREVGKKLPGLTFYTPRTFSDVLLRAVLGQSFYGADGRNYCMGGFINGPSDDEKEFRHPDTCRSLNSDELKGMDPEILRVLES